MKDDLVERVALAMRTRTRPVGTMLECEDLARAVLAIARPAILEEAAKVAETAEMRTLDDKGGMKPIWGRSQIAAAIRGLAHTTGQEPERTCPICAEPFKADDICAADINEGTCHAECLEGSPVVYLDTGEPSEGPIDTFTYGQEGGR